VKLLGRSAHSGYRRADSQENWCGPVRVLVQDLRGLTGNRLLEPSQATTG
jgi:hypothetical protein